MTVLVRCTRAELLRLVRWPAAWAILGAWLALSLTFGYLFNYVTHRTGTPNFADDGVTGEQLLAGLLPAAVPDVLVQGMPMFGGALMLVLGGIAAGNGYGWATWKTVFTQGPSRLLATTGALVALSAVVLTVVLTTLALFIATSLVIALVEGQSVAWPSVGSLTAAVLGGVLVLEMWVLLGFALGTLARGPALAVGLGLVWGLVVENLLRGVGSLLGPVESLTHVLPGTAAGSLVGALIDVGGSPGDTPGVLDVLSGPQAVVTVCVYAVSAAALTLGLIGRRDVT